MKVREHLYLFYLATSCWTFFFLGGLWSDYFQSWSMWLSLIVIDLIPAIALGFLSVSLIRSMTPKNPERGAFWTAFYFTLPLFVYDVIYLGIYKELGGSFLVTHWYLSVFYVIPWIVTFGLVKLRVV